MTGQRVDTGLFHASVSTAAAVLAVYNDGSTWETTFTINAGQQQIAPASYARLLREVADELDAKGDAW